MKVLLWKEWKEISWLWLVSILSITILTPLTEGADIFFRNIAIYFIVVYSGFIGARAFAGERTIGTLDYLYTRPAHQETSWNPQPLQKTWGWILSAYPGC